MNAERANPDLGGTPMKPERASNPLGLAPGSLIGGRYLTGRLLGRGAMGIVFEGTHHELGEHVAIKFLLPDHLENAEIVGRFSREAKAAVKLKGEHVARVLDVGKHEGRIPFIVMEYLDGEDLGHRVDTTGPLLVEEACGYAIEACAGLAEAHARGIVHRDVKPENLFLTRLADGRQRIKILDFGVSKVALTGSALDEHDLAATSTMLGSPLYMSPEQIRSRDVDHRSDIWSLGVSLYELLAGKTPFHAGTITELVGRVLEETPPPLRDIRPDVPEALERVIFRCLVRDPAQRWESVASLAIALLPFAPRSSREIAETARGLVMRADESASLSRIPTPPLVPASVPPPPLSGSTAAAITSVPAETPANRSRGALLAAPVLLLVLAAVAFVALRAPKETIAAPDAARTAASGSPSSVGQNTDPTGHPAIAAVPALLPSAEPTGSAAPAASVAPAGGATATDAGTREHTPPRTGPRPAVAPTKTTASPPKDDIRLTR